MTSTPTVRLGDGSAKRPESDPDGKKTRPGVGSLPGRTGSEHSGNVVRGKEETPGTDPDELKAGDDKDGDADNGKDGENGNGNGGNPGNSSRNNDDDQNPDNGNCGNSGSNGTGSCGGGAGDDTDDPTPRHDAPNQPDERRASSTA